MEGEFAWSRWEEMGDALVPPSLQSLCRMLPEQLYLLYDPGRRRYCYRTLASTEDCGLLAFSQPHLAHAYTGSCLIGSGYTQVVPVSLDQACGRAREHHAVVNSVIFNLGRQSWSTISNLRLFITYVESMDVESMDVIRGVLRSGNGLIWFNARPDRPAAV